MRPYWKGYLKLALVSCPIALASVVTAESSASISQSSSCLSAPARSFGKKWRGCTGSSAAALP
jgi:hypothetical protein